MRTRHMKALVSLASEWGRPLMKVPTGSMRPSLREGDLIALERCGASGLRRGDIVVFERAGRMWAHRLLGLHRPAEGAAGPGGLIVKADSRFTPDAPVRTADVLGRVRYAVREGRRVELSTPWARLKGVAAGLAYPAARLPVAGARALCRRLLGSRRAVRLEIGRVRLEVLCTAPELARKVASAAARHGPSRRGVDARLVLRTSEVLAAAPRTAGARRDGGALLVWGPGFRLRVDAGSHSAEATVLAGAGPSAVSCILRNVATEFAVRAGRAVLHASCALRGGRGYVFAGSSGSGKTTCASMLPGAQKVLDDLVFIGVERGEALVLPSPDFERTGPGLTGVPRPVAAVFVLSPEGGGGAEATDLVGAAAAAGLCSLPSPAAEDEGAGRALEAAVELAERVPVVRLRFGLGEDELDRIARAAGQARTSARDGPG